MLLVFLKWEHQLMVMSGSISTHLVKLVYMNLPVRGILKPGLAISTNSVGTGDAYVLHS